MQNGSATAILITSEITYNRIGIGYSGTSYPWNGLIDDVRVYNQSMSTSQIQQSYFLGINNLYKNNGITSNEFNQRLIELKYNLANNE